MKRAHEINRVPMEEETWYNNTDIVHIEHVIRANAWKENDERNLMLGITHVTVETAADMGLPHVRSLLGKLTLHCGLGAAFQFWVYQPGKEANTDPVHLPNIITEKIKHQGGWIWELRYAYQRQQDKVEITTLKGEKKEIGGRQKVRQTLAHTQEEYQERGITNHDSTAGVNEAFLAQAMETAIAYFAPQN